MTLAEKMERLADSYNDSGCFWTMHFGTRGTGNMIESCIGESIHSEADTFAEAIDDIYAQRFKEEPHVPQGSVTGQGSPGPDRPGLMVGIPVPGVQPVMVDYFFNPRVDSIEYWTQKWRDALKGYEARLKKAAGETDDDPKPIIVSREPPCS